MNQPRDYSPLDRLLMHADTALRTVFGKPVATERPDPALGVADAELSDADQRQALRLMRVNHTGEVCAQALYQGQALTARDPAVRQAMDQAAQEENDHLIWCERRVSELGGHTSYLNPLFYLGALTIGTAAGLAGDRWSLGFLAETERQVVRHLDGHLQRLSAEDARTRRIVEQMKQDEGEHATAAMQAGAAHLPTPLPQLMRLASRVMTGTTYWL